MSRYPYIDRHPCIVAAGKSFGSPCENAKHLFQHVTLADKIDAVRKQFGFIEAKDYGTELVKLPNEETEGAFTEIRHCLRRPEPTSFQTLEEELKNTIYDSYWNKALGKCRDPVPGLPLGMNPARVTFGKASVRSEPAAVVVNPPKKAEQVQEEEKCYHCLYAFSHQDHYPGEQIKRDYSSSFNECNFFGKSSGKDESGERVRKCLTWFNNDPISNVSRRLAAVRNRTLPPLGKGIDKTGVTDLFSEDHTYGVPTPGDFCGVEDLLNECMPSLMRRDMQTFLACANALRQNVYKKINSGEFILEDLYDEITNLIQDKKGDETEYFVHFDCICKILRKHRINVVRDKLEPLLVILGLLKENGEIKVRDFIDFIDKNKRFPELKKEHYIMPPEFQECGQRYRSEFCAAKDIRGIQMMPAAGLPTVRMDKAAPVYYDSLVNMDHLGEETTARTLISPSIYTQYGLSHRDFFRPRTKEFLDNFFRKINVDLPEKDLDEIYKKGYELDQTGGVCVETFRNLLDERVYKAYSRST